MISEIENIKKGLVVSTVEYDTSKKIIGVSTTNLMPGPNGIAPLEKQGAFQVQDASETIDFAQALNNTQNQPAEQVEEHVELPILGASTENNGLKVPVTSDVISENPVQVENPANLTGFEIPNIESVQEETKEEVVTEPVAIDIQMPEMPSVVVADEPTGLNESLFEGANPQTTTSILEETVPAVAETQTTIETVQPQENVQAPTETTMNIEIPTLPTDTVQEVQAQPAAVQENIMEAIPTTAPEEEIPTFDIEMPAIGDTAKVEETEAVPETPVQSASQVLGEPAEVVEENKASTINEVTDIAIEAEEEEVLKTYKESMEAIISNFNKAQIELLNECVETLRKMKTVKKETKEEIIEKPVEQQTVPETDQTSQQVAPQTEIAPGNPLESAAFEIIDAMSAPKM